jgi:DNA-directed RNA polymerase specialized sigma24 family protein
MEELIPVAAPEGHRVEDDELRVVYLRECLRGLSKESRELITEYYREEGSAKIEDRKALAGKLGISLNALFSRAKRIRDRLEKCVTRRLRRKPGGASIQTPPAHKAQRQGGDPQ